MGAAKPGDLLEIKSIGGERAFRRRLMELGLLPGTKVAFVGVAPLGDPVELCVRGSSVSIRREEARQIRVQPLVEARVPDCTLGAATPRFGMQ